MIGGIVTFQMLRRRREKIILDTFAGSDVQTKSELDSYLSTALKGLLTEHLVRSQISPSGNGARDLYNVDFTDSGLNLME